MGTPASLFTVCFALLFAPFVFLHCSRAEHEVVDKKSKVTKDADLWLPPNSRVVQFTDPDRFVDPVWAARIELPAAAREAFVSALAEKPTDDTQRTGSFAETVSWWHPKRVVFEKQYLANRQTLVNVVVAAEHGGIVAYVECMVF